MYTEADLGDPHPDASLNLNKLKSLTDGIEKKRQIARNITGKNNEDITRFLYTDAGLGDPSASSNV